jgi:hypothetical protein
MIIGINGKIGSGKDTVGKIIQYLTSESGDPNSSRYRGYEEFLSKGGGSALRNFDQHYVSDWEIKKFAGKLKQTASLLTGIDIEDFEDQEFKKLYMSPEWGMTYREFLQKLGTEAMREGLHTNVWVNALFADYIHTKNCGCEKNCRCEHDLPNWLITDMRFPNEMEAVVEKGGITIRVMRPIHALSQENHCGLLHPSEIALDGHTMHYEIINDGTIEDLVEKVREVLIKENII